MPLMQLNRVVFPAPFGPMTEKICPGCTSKPMLVRASRPPNEMESFSTLKKLMSFFFFARFRLRVCA